MRKLALIMTCICISLMTTGCWDYQEVDRQATILAIGIDRIPGSKSILVTVQIAKSQREGSKETGGQGGAKSFTVMNGEGKSLSEAIRHLSIQSTRHILLSHCKTVVLGKDFAETGVGEVLDELKRDREFRRTDWMLTTDKTAKEILETDIAMEQLPVRGLDNILLIFEKVGRVQPMNFNNFFARLYGESQVSFTPLVQLEDIDKRITSQLEKAVDRPLDSEKKPKTLTIGKTAVFKNLRMVGVLNEDDSRTHRWLVNSPKGTIITFSYAPLAQTNGEKGEIFLDIMAGKTTITPKVTEDGITMTIVMTAKVLLHETGASGINVLDPKEIEQLERQATETMTLQLEQMIDKVQKKLKSDCIGFAENLHDYYPVEWKKIKHDWDDIFPTVDYQISCEVEILKTGAVNNPTLRSEPEE